MVEIEPLILAKRYIQASEQAEMHGKLDLALLQAELAIVALTRWKQAIADEQGK